MVNKFIGYLLTHSNNSFRVGSIFSSSVPMGGSFFYYTPPWPIHRQEWPPPLKNGLKGIKDPGNILLPDEE
jgi:hypothetical protein